MFPRWKVCLLAAVIALTVASADSPSNSSSFVNSSHPISDDDFENDENLLFTAEQLKQGGVLLFIFGIVYLVSGIIIASNEFFVPSLAVMMDQLKMKEDVAGVTIMTLGIILPKLILGIIGVFIAVPEASIAGFVGSSLHNILVVIGFCALLTSEATVIPCWILVRDWLSFLILIVVYILFSLDGSVAIWECIILILFYVAYIICVTTMVKIKPKIEELICKKAPQEDIQLEEEQKSSANDTEDITGSPLTPTRPSGSCPNMVLHIIFFPIILLLFISLPDPRNPKSRKLSVLSFIGSVIWIHAFSFLTIMCFSTVGSTLGIPPELMGFFIPSVSLLTCVVAARSGYTVMAVCAALGVNIFSIALDGPLPWLIYSVLFSSAMEINAAGLACTAILFLFFWLLALITLLLARKRMKRLVGLFLVIFYVLFVFISLAFVFEFVKCPV